LLWKKCPHRHHRTPDGRARQVRQSPPSPAVDPAAEHRPSGVACSGHTVAVERFHGFRDPRSGPGVVSITSRPTSTQAGPTNVHQVWWTVRDMPMPAAAINKSITRNKRLDRDDRAQALVAGRRRVLLILRSCTPATVNHIDPGSGRDISFDIDKYVEGAG
jgi:hypothetical protein